MTAQDMTNTNSGLEISNADAVTMRLVLSGSWCLQDRLPSVESVIHQFSSDPGIERITFSSDGITRWDTALLVFLSKLNRSCQENQLQVISDGLPAGIRKLLDLAASSPATKDTARSGEKENLLSHIGNTTLDIIASAPDALRFLGAALKA